jgi:hypothetical protein
MITNDKLKKILEKYDIKDNAKQESIRTLVLSRSFSWEKLI